MLEKALVMMLKLNQKITHCKFFFLCFYTCVTGKMFKYSDKMCWLGKQHGRQWLLESTYAKMKKNKNSQRLGAILPPVTQIFVSTTYMLLEKKKKKTKLKSSCDSARKTPTNIALNYCSERQILRTRKCTWFYLNSILHVQKSTRCQWHAWQANWAISV